MTLTERFAKMYGPRQGQLSDLHGLIVFRALMKDAQDLKASLLHHKRPVVWYGIWFTTAASIVLVPFYTMTPAEWYLGVLAAAGLGATFFLRIAAPTV